MRIDSADLDSFPGSRENQSNGPYLSQALMVLKACATIIVWHWWWTPLSRTEHGVQTRHCMIPTVCLPTAPTHLFPHPTCFLKENTLSVQKWKWWPHVGPETLL